MEKLGKVYSRNSFVSVKFEIRKSFIRNKQSSEYKYICTDYLSGGGIKAMPMGNFSVLRVFEPFENRYIQFGAYQFGLS